MPMVAVAQLPLHAESRVVVAAQPRERFAFLDDRSRLGAHMRESSWMMAGGRMSFTLDERIGRTVGSVIRLSGRVLGMALSVEEAVSEHKPPRRTAWQTMATPPLLVIGPYRMGFAIASHRSGSVLTLFIDYALPASGVGR
jgi:hypothetical protein